MPDPSFSEIWSEIQGRISVLAVAGIGGAFFRAVIAPEKEWKRRVAQGVAGAISALALGGIAGQIIDNTTGAGIWSYLASGFLFGSGGETAVKIIQDRILGKDNDRNPTGE